MTKTSSNSQTPQGKALQLAAGTLLGLTTLAATAQDQPSPTHEKTRIIRIQNAATQADQNELVTALRNVLTPSVHIYLVANENAIVLRGPDADFNEAQTLVTELDRPHRLYRLTFTVRDSDASKEVGNQHFSVVVAAGQRVQFKQGSRIPIITGSVGTTSPTPQTQYTYIDVGINFDATVAELTNGLNLRTKIERSSIAEDKLDVGREDPIIRSSIIEGTSIVTLNKPLNLGSLDTLGSTRHVDIDVTAELAK